MIEAVFERIAASMSRLQEEKYPVQSPLYFSRTPAKVFSIGPIRLKAQKTSQLGHS